jgi:hypothetical protein
LDISLHVGREQPVPLVNGKNFIESTILPKRFLVALVSAIQAALINYRSGEDIVLPVGEKWDIDLVTLSNTGKRLAMVSRGRSLVL